MTWNYRVMSKKTPHGNGYGIVEAYYDEGSDEAHSWTEDYVPVHEETLEELRETLTRMLEALDKPVLEDTD